MGLAQLILGTWLPGRFYGSGAAYPLTDASDSKLDLLASHSNGPFAPHVRNVYSQCGEDGILQHLFARLGITNGYCVEFGAWDGRHLSNTYNLITAYGWRGTLIEADSVRFAELRRTMDGIVGVTTLQAFVGFEDDDGLDVLLAPTDTPKDFDLLSIDIDGNDYHVWAAISAYRPKVVVIEFNPTIPNHIPFVQRRDTRVKHGSSLLSLTALAASKGYSPVAVTAQNAIFLKQEVARRLRMEALSLHDLRPWHDGETNLLHLYDGTVLLAGASGEQVVGVPHRLRGLQLLPSFLRVYPPDARTWQRGLTALFRVARRRQGTKYVAGDLGETRRPR